VWQISFQNQIQRCFGYFCAKNRQNIATVSYSEMAKPDPRFYFISFRD